MIRLFIADHTPEPARQRPVEPARKPVSPRRCGRSGAGVGLAALLLAMGLALGSGCEEPAPCRAACEHACDICGTDCSDQDIDTCTQSCEDSQTPADRASCVIDTDTCDDLWKC